MTVATRAVGNLLVVAAPSGAGKTSLVTALVAADPKLYVSVSHTTRPKRPLEVEGKHYHYVDDQTFSNMVDAGLFLESAIVYGYRYGTSKQAVEQQLARGDDVILEIDWQGARIVREHWPHSKSVFIIPPSHAALESRLRQRGQDSPNVISARLAQAVADISHASEFDFLLVNDEFNEALKYLKNIISRLRGGGQPVLPDISELVTQILSQQDGE